MRRYLLDNGVVVAYIKGRSGAMQMVQPWIIRREVVTSMLVYGEAIEYFKAYQDFPRYRTAVRTLLREVRPLQLTYAILERYVDLRRAMRPPHGAGLIGDVDTLIAATALEHDLAVVTLDSDFTRVPNLSARYLRREALL